MDQWHLQGRVLSSGMLPQSFFKFTHNSFLLPELAVFVGFEVVFIVDGRLFFHFLHFSPFLSSSTLLI